MATSQFFALTVEGVKSYVYNTRVKVPVALDIGFRRAGDGHSYLFVSCSHSPGQSPFPVRLYIHNVVSRTEYAERSRLFHRHSHNAIIMFGSVNLCAIVMIAQLLCSLKTHACVPLRQDLVDVRLIRSYYMKTKPTQLLHTSRDLTESGVDVAVMETFYVLVHIATKYSTDHPLFESALEGFCCTVLARSPTLPLEFEKTYLCIAALFKQDYPNGTVDLTAVIKKISDVVYGDERFTQAPLYQVDYILAAVTYGHSLVSDSPVSTGNLIACRQRIQRFFDLIQDTVSKSNGTSEILVAMEKMPINSLSKDQKRNEEEADFFSDLLAVCTGHGPRIDPKSYHISSLPRAEGVLFYLISLTKSSMESVSDLIQDVFHAWLCLINTHCLKYEAQSVIQDELPTALRIFYEMFVNEASGDDIQIPHQSFISGLKTILSLPDPTTKLFTDELKSVFIEAIAWSEKQIPIRVLKKADTDAIRIRSRVLRFMLALRISLGISIPKPHLFFNVLENIQLRCPCQNLGPKTQVAISKLGKVRAWMTDLKPDLPDSKAS